MRDPPRLGGMAEKHKVETSNLLCSLSGENIGNAGRYLKAGRSRSGLQGCAQIVYARKLQTTMFTAPQEEAAGIILLVPSMGKIRLKIKQ